MIWIDIESIKKRNWISKLNFLGRRRHSAYHCRIGGHRTRSKGYDWCRWSSYSANSARNGQTNCAGHTSNDQCPWRRSESAGAWCSNGSERKMERRRWLRPDRVSEKITVLFSTIINEIIYLKWYHIIISSTVYIHAQQQHYNLCTETNENT